MLCLARNTRYILSIVLSRTAASHEYGGNEDSEALGANREINA